MKTKKQLYESIMKDVSKIVKKHLNEDIENSWDDTYMANVLTWINNTVSDPDELEYAITEYFDLSKKAPHENANNIGYGIANLMMAKLDAGGMDMVFPQKYNKDNFSNAPSSKICFSGLAYFDRIPTGRSSNVSSSSINVTITLCFVLGAASKSCTVLPS